MPFDNSGLWKWVFGAALKGEHKDHAQTITHSLKEMRKQLKALTGEISNDLKDYTVHDITHLDALWDVAGQIIGDDYPINPLELFVLGGAFLVHDAGMTCAAYPGGIKEIKQHKDWAKTLHRFMGDENGDAAQAQEMALKTFLREQHALRAEELPSVEWPSKEGHRALIENVDMRQKFGEFIGKVSASHWWNHEDLADKLDRIVPAPPPYPNDWSIDLLKIACILRVSDACQIDSGRAPGFLWALRKPFISEYSNMHWSFQNKLSQPECRDDALVYGSTKDFTRAESAEWWIMYDAIKMIDGELRKTDDLLYNLRRNDFRFRAKRVAGVDSPKALTRTIKVSGWQPIDTAYSISDIPKIVEKLGGDQLYGDDVFAPVRELIQNAMDAVRLKRLVDGKKNEGAVDVEIFDRGDIKILKISDEGIGMSADSIVENLLSFGTSGWLQDPAIGEYSPEFAAKNDFSGQYGIGFFSAFMLGEKLTVTTRRFDKSASDTIVLQFNNGLKERPILFSAEGPERKLIGGTTIEIELKPEAASALLGASTGGYYYSFSDKLGAQFPVSDVKIKLQHDGTTEEIDGSNWRTEPAETLLRRIEGRDRTNGVAGEYAKNLRAIKGENGNVIGRLCITPNFRDEDGDMVNAFGAIVSKGARVNNINLRGFVEGSVERAARDMAWPNLTRKALERWASEQASIIASKETNFERQMECAERVIVCGGDVDALKLCESSQGFLSAAKFIEYIQAAETTTLVDVYYVRSERVNGKTIEIANFVVATERERPPLVYNHGRYRFAASRSNSKELSTHKSISDILIEHIVEEFNIDPEVIVEFERVDNKGRPVYVSRVVIGHDAEGKEIMGAGKTFHRGMTMDDLAQYKVER